MPNYDPVNPAYNRATKQFQRGQMFPEDLNFALADLLTDFAAMLAAGGGTGGGAVGGHILFRDGSDIRLRDGTILAHR